MSGRLLLLAALTWALGCGAPPNTHTFTVNSGPSGKFLNGPFTDVTVCVPGTSQCQTLSGILVDTGSSGLRVLASALQLSLPQVTGSNGTLAECAQFVTSYTWGPIAKADLQLGQEKALGIPVQVIAAPGFAPAPTRCTATGLPSGQTADALGANGILGLSQFVADCGDACASQSGSNPGLYDVCSASQGCTPAAVPVQDQVQNPVAHFPKDNNGLSVELPAIGDQGGTNVKGTLTFGIGTEDNNGLGGAVVLASDSAGHFQTHFQGTSVPAFLDTGSNALFFLDAATTGLTTCSDVASFYCPASPTRLSVTNLGTNQASIPTNITVVNADALTAQSKVNAFATLAGPDPGTFDWGLPFFFGRKVFVALEGGSTPAGVGPYSAY